MAKKRTKQQKTGLNNHHLALALGLFFALLHALWALAVGLNLGQKFMDWAMPLHFIDKMYSVVEFNIATAVFLVIAAFIGGYIMGWIFAAIYNWVAKR